MGGEITSGTWINAFTQSSVSGTQTCESVKTMVYCDDQGNLHSLAGTSSLYPACKRSGQ
jgi:hypothetical protein